MRSKARKGWREAREEVLAQWEAEYIAGVMEEADGCVTRAAELAGLAPSRMHVLITRSGNDHLRQGRGYNRAA